MAKIRTYGKRQHTIKEKIKKADHFTSTEPTLENLQSAEQGKLNPPYPIVELQKLMETSTILQQCVEAYRRNIVGYGTLAQSIDGEMKDDNPQLKAEIEQIKSFVRFFSFDKSFEDIFGDAIEDREVTGNGYVEILRDTLGRVASGERLDPAFMYVCKMGDLVTQDIIIEGQKFKQKKRFRKYVQEVAGKKVYFKEIGDQRKMDSRNGNYVDDIEEEFEANEVLHLKVGTSAYGIPRWIGQLIHIYGARKAEELNYNYFSQGRHTPMAILLHNAELSPQSEEALSEYVQSVEGTENAHKFLVIEADGLDEGIVGEKGKANAKVELKSLADMLQQDALFLEYDNASREKVQSAFRLPDIYVGRSKDFNRATADTARSITEEQVFEPERNSLEWQINNKLLLAHELKVGKLAFKKAEISDTESTANILKVINEIGGVAPNDVRDLLGKVLGKDIEQLTGDEYNKPVPKQPIKPEDKTAQTLKKALGDDLTSIMKDTRDLLESIYDAERNK